jgi:hypothetical protein
MVAIREDAMRFIMMMAGAMLGSISTAALAQSAATADATSSITIVRGITIARDTDLAFGRCIQPTATGTVAVALDGTRTTTGVACLGGMASAASFTVTGDGGAAITVTVPASVTMTGPGTDIVVSLVNNAPMVLGGTPDTLGTAVFQVGGTATLAAAQTQGAYSGIFQVTAAYQ